MNGMNGISPELMYRLVTDYHDTLLREAAEERQSHLARTRGNDLRLRIGRGLVRAGEALAGPRTLPADRRSRVRTAKADGC